MDSQDRKKHEEGHTVAYFHGEMVLDSPESYTLEEKKKIYEEMVASTEKVDSVTRSEFRALSPEGQAKMFEMLVNSGVETPKFWSDLLLGD